MTEDQAVRFTRALSTAFTGWVTLAADPSRNREATVTAAALIGQLAGLQTFLADWVGNPQPADPKGD